MLPCEPVATAETWWYSGPSIRASPEQPDGPSLFHMYGNMSVRGSAKSNMSYSGSITLSTRFQRTTSTPYQ